MKLEPKRVHDWLAAVEVRPVGDASNVCLVELGSDGVDALSDHSWNDWSGEVGSLCPEADLIFLLPEGLTSRLPLAFATIQGLHRAVTGDARNPVTLRSEHERTCGEAVLWVPPSLAWFKGHFPGHPVVPGVVLIGWAVEAIRPHLADQSRICEFRQMKFQKVVVPCTTPKLTWHIESNMVSFQLRSMEGTHAKAQFMLGECS